MKNLSIIISNNSKEPIYGQIYSQIKDQIVRRIIKSGDPLPSIRILAKDLKVSVITTKRAYDDLERDGYIYTLIGKGSYVSDLDIKKINSEIMKELEIDIRKIVIKSQKYGYSKETLIEIIKEIT